MTCQMDIILFQPMSLVVNERSEKSGAFPRHCFGIKNFLYAQNFSRQTSKLYLTSYRNGSLLTTRGWRIAFALNTDGFTANNNKDDLNGDNSVLGETFLGRIVSAGGRQLLTKLDSARKNFPMKVFLLLLGFYTANALATILGQTGDWDVLVGGVIVAAIEGSGMLMYKKAYLYWKVAVSGGYDKLLESRCLLRLIC